jgi:Protein of unknown function (DUF4230)
VDLERLRKLPLWLPPLVALLIGAGLGLLLRPSTQASSAGPDPVALTDATLLSVREQGRLTLFTARFVAIVTATETRLGLTARKTLIMPGQVRYGVDLGRLRREHLRWDPATRTLSVTLPPLEIAGPEIDLNQVREHAEGGIVMALTDAEEALDETNRRAAQEDLMRQARERAPMALAREAALRAVARSFAMPLRAAGIEASVSVRFLSPSGTEEASFLDRPRRTEDSIEDRRAGTRPAP